MSPLLQRLTCGLGLLGRDDIQGSSKMASFDPELALVAFVLGRMEVVSRCECFHVYKPPCVTDSVSLLSSPKGNKDVNRLKIMTPDPPTVELVRDQTQTTNNDGSDAGSMSKVSFLNETSS